MLWPIELIALIPRSVTDSAGKCQDCFPRAALEPNSFYALHARRRDARLPLIFAFLVGIRLLAGFIRLEE